jgi:hypothetical protein
MFFLLLVQSPYSLVADANLTEYALLIVTYLFNRFVMNEFPQEIVDFDNKAKKIFFSLYENFARSAKQLDRQKDDNVFQQQQSKYLNTLKTSSKI